MPTINTGTHPKALWPGIHAWWGRKYASHPDETRDLFDWTTSDKAYEEQVEITSFPIATVKPEGDAVTYVAETQGKVERTTHVAYAQGYIVTYEELKDNKYTDVSQTRSEANAYAMHSTKQIVGALVYDRSSDASYTFGDGVALLDTAHPTNAGNQSNELSTAADLSEASLEDLLIQIGNAKNANGLQIPLSGEKLVVPVNLCFEAERILKSVQRVGTADNDINAIRSKGLLPGGIVVNHYLSDTDAWYVRTNAPHGLVAYQREPISFSQDNDFDTKNAKAVAYERYSFSVGDFRGLYGSAGA